MDDGTDHKIASFRERIDGYYGWQCLCGNNSLMTVQERNEIADPTSPKPQEVADIVKNLAPVYAVDTPDGLVVDKFILREV